VEIEVETDATGDYSDEVYLTVDVELIFAIYATGCIRSRVNPVLQLVNPVLQLGVFF